MTTSKFIFRFFTLDDETVRAARCAASAARGCSVGWKVPERWAAAGAVGSALGWHHHDPQCAHPSLSLCTPPCPLPCSPPFCRLQLEGLEISYMMTNSREMWMMGMVWFFLMAGMATAAFLNARSNLLYSSWTFLTVLISMLSFIGFLAEVGRLRWFTASAALDIALAVLVSFVFLPIWMAWTGIFLVAIRAKDFTEVPVSGDAANGRPTRSVPSAVDV